MCCREQYICRLLYLYNILTVLYIELKWIKLERGVYMYSIDKILCTVGYMYNINNSNLNSVRGSACARMSSTNIKVLTEQ